MSKHCPFPLPPGVTYDGPWPGVKPPMFVFTDRAETGGTFALYRKDFSAAGVSRELSKLRETFAAAREDAA